MIILIIRQEYTWSLNVFTCRNRAWTGPLSIAAGRFCTIPTRYGIFITDYVSCMSHECHIRWWSNKLCKMRTGAGGVAWCNCPLSMHSSYRDFFQIRWPIKCMPPAESGHLGFPGEIDVVSSNRWRDQNPRGRLILKSGVIHASMCSGSKVKFSRWHRRPFVSFTLFDIKRWLWCLIICFHVRVITWKMLQKHQSNICTM